jgi:hypothetical protein
MNDNRIFGILVVGFSALRPFGLAVPPVKNDEAISLKPVGCGFIGAAGGARPPVDCAVG